MLLPGETRLAQLIHLMQYRQPTYELFPRHLAEGGEVDVIESGMPQPRVFVSVRCQAHWTCKVDVERVQAPDAPGHSRQQTHLLITDAHHTPPFTSTSYPALSSCPMEIMLAVSRGR